MPEPARVRIPGAPYLDYEMWAGCPIHAALSHQGASREARPLSSPRAQTPALEIVILTLSSAKGKDLLLALAVARSPSPNLNRPGATSRARLIARWLGKHNPRVRQEAA